MILFCISASTWITSGLVLDCHFMIVRNAWGEYYACNAQNLQTSKNDRTVTDVKGIHIEGKTNDDVKEFYVRKGNCPFLPHNLGEFFKNLEVFYVEKSGVKLLTRQDLSGLNKLKVFDVSNNPIERLEKKFFLGHSSIENISFYNCELLYIDANVLDPLTNLQRAHFEDNYCISAYLYYPNYLPTLKERLKNCDGTMIVESIEFHPLPNY